MSAKLAVSVVAGAVFDGRAVLRFTIASALLILRSMARSKRGA